MTLERQSPGGNRGRKDTARTGEQNLTPSVNGVNPAASSDKFRKVIEEAGLLPDTIINDGQLHRCPVADKPHGKDGAYILHPDLPASGWWQNWRTDESGTWTEKQERTLTAKERTEFHARIERDKAVREVAEAERHTEAAGNARRILAEAPACETHKYLTRKGVQPFAGLKVGRDGALLVPVLDTDGKAMSLQRIYGDGTKRFLTGGKKKGGFLSIIGEDGPRYIVEGYATGATVHQATGNTVLVAFDSGNLLPVSHMVRERYPEQEIVIAGDDDHQTEGNPGKSKAIKAAQEIGARVALPTFTSPAGQTDFNDLAQAEGLEVVRTQLAEAREPSSEPKKKRRKETSGSPSGFPFILKPGGVYYLAEKSDGGIDQEWLCSPLSVLALTRDPDGGDWGRLLEVEDPDSVRHRWAMPMSMTAGSGEEYRAQLKSMGLRLAPGSNGKNRLDLYINLSRPETRARCVSRIGWHGGRFVFPDTVYGQGQAEEVVFQGADHENIFRVAGTLEEWRKKVGRLCVGNSRLMLAVSAALAAPLLEPAGMESGGFHFMGGSSLGKTTAIVVGGSVCGGGGIRGFIRTWRATDNGLEAVAAKHCDCLLCLDELSQVDSRAAGACAYMLANGQGKTRSKKDGTSRKPQEWRTLFLSTGEISLADKIQEDGKRRAMAGQSVRVVDIPADAGAGCGLFENLYDYRDGDTFARALKDATSRFYGTPLRVFLEHIAGDLEEVARQVKTFSQTFTEKHCPPEANGQVKRVCGRFALVAAAGEIGVEYGVLPWPQGEASAAAVKCFRAWLENRGGTDAAEVQASLSQVRTFFQSHGSSRFEDLDTGQEQRIINRAGYRRKGADGQVRFMVFPEIFRNEVCAGFNHKTVCQTLLRLGALLSDHGRNTKKERTPDSGAAGINLYVVTSVIFDGNTGNTGNAAEKVGENLFPQGKSVPGTPGTEAGGQEPCSHCSHSSQTDREQEKANDIGTVLVVPTVLTQKDNVGNSFPHEVEI